MENSAIRLTCTRLPSVFKTFVLSIFERPLKTGFTVAGILQVNMKKFWRIIAHKTIQNDKDDGPFTVNSGVNISWTD